MTAVLPSEDELKQALIALRAENPSLGIAKLHTLLLSRNPTWTVGEKRTRRILQNEGLTLVQNQKSGASQKDGSGPGHDLPSSTVIEGLDISKWTLKVEVKYFSRNKGKGLVAKERIKEGETVWKEDPFILAPEWDVYDLQAASLACAHCSTPLKESSLIISCPASTSRSPCTARFCNRLCLTRSARTHPLLCPSQNPASIQLLTFARKIGWMALHALAQCTARILLTYQQDESAWREDWKFIQSLAKLGMEDRAKGEWMKGAEPDRETWKKAFQLYVQGFQNPPTVPEQKKLARLLKKALPAEVVGELFNYDAFLLGLGCMSLNLEAHGGLYVFHSHLNHSCDPSISVRHLEQRTALARVSLIAKKDIEPGEELCITYVNPGLPLEQRRREIMEWGFGVCQCRRCTTEAENHDSAPVGSASMNDLESELKTSLGVM
ncbi:SET domain-containing protein [Laetiporus sulphureus 93-53]|uniref:Histone-lysine N-methyltransferase SET5 n=1 Tax=Laetiporus sulphureus 93-53 TaxID=1314785 RepID=A0A165B5B3_9APHY|nr:SET domain-containing protein [Laetiporus sulphureus 93-53]KZT00270.1 SET domain-containing protein [Laetiporus sulphureus 93-53]